MIVKIESKGGVVNGKYRDDQGQVWSIARLIEAAKWLEPFDVPLAGIYIGSCVFGRDAWNVRELAEHVKRVQDADLSYPVIMDHEGFICDGWHRVVKALVEGRETIKAVRFDDMPCCDFQEEG